LDYPPRPTYFFGFKFPSLAVLVGEKKEEKYKFKKKCKQIKTLPKNLNKTFERKNITFNE